MCLDYPQIEPWPSQHISAELQTITNKMINRLLRHNFFQNCIDNSIEIEVLRNFLIQHAKYSSYFTRYLCALISQLEHNDDVQALATNLAEELGFGAKEEDPHSYLYSNMLKDFGLNPEQYPIYPETINLIDTMFMLCRQPNGIAALGALCFGAEAIVPAMYTHITNAFLHHGVKEQQLAFFSLHIECDDSHAETMYKILAREFLQNPKAKVEAVNAGEIALNSRLRFFDALLQERK